MRVRRPRGSSPPSRYLADRVVQLLGALLVLLILAEATVYPHYQPAFPWHLIPGYAAVIGLLGCIVVVIGSKWLGKNFLQRAARDDE
jgi:hypothetical protein